MIEATQADAAIMQVAARLDALLGRDKRVVVVTGYEEADGASLLAAQLSVALARLSEAPVVVVDANRGAAALHEYFQLPNAQGLSDVLAGGDEYDVLQETPFGVAVLAAGEGSGPIAALSAGRLLEKLKARYRYILIAAPPVLQSSDTVLLCGLSDGAVFSLLAGQRHVKEIKEMQKELARLETPLLGAVMRERKR
ncbi:MAG: CpsD/CapB family tyrosine-protein kinase [Bryobacter sp.]|nr:CpsD/CapB family tyrosine-protein kinase [Bryobacter sp.]